jgi:hypothetical protein
MPMQMASTKLHRGPVAGDVNSRIVNHRDSQITKRSPLLNLDILPSM